MTRSSWRLLLITRATLTVTANHGPLCLRGSLKPFASHLLLVFTEDSHMEGSSDNRTVDSAPANRINDS